MSWRRPTIVPGDRATMLPMGDRPRDGLIQEHIPGGIEFEITRVEDIRSSYGYAVGTGADVAGGVYLTNMEVIG